ncbi:Ger(x)C family spore germination protein [Paenibacillus psychroresistens]|uniref:Ger(X)C family spore germination protein n=1 Tax=Paenibacillus psychroresistens TaxID=1778678 RepID=A0A6B8RQM7_9BACL|nr:Ger(x)C family spore germination protein [Paenibacillus psychroresistens]QGQ97686.1 Ger(x)C family spore germination protein [Paenibacillus psychroresistens]
MNKLMRSLFLLLFVPLLGGCWDRIEMNDLSIFMASALDITEAGDLKVSIQVPIPAGASGEGGKVSSGGTLGKTYFVVSATGTNLYDCERKIQQKMSRHFFKGHRRIVFIGEALAKKGIQDILDYFSRDPGSRLRTYLVVAKGKEASEVIQNDHPTERIPAEEVRELERSGFGTAVTFRDFLMTQARDGIVPVIGAVELVTPTDDLKNGEASKFKFFRISSTAVFKNYKLTGYMNDIETRSLRWIKGELKQEYLGNKLPGINGNVGVELDKMGSKIKTRMNGDKAQVRIELNGAGVINEFNAKMDLSQRESIAIIEKELGDLIAEETLQTVRKAQTEWKADIFGIGLQLHQFHFQTWKKVRSEWETIFSNADITVTAKISLQRAGIITNSFENKRVGTK